MSSHLGNLFRIVTFGESHGNAVGCVVDGCPAGLTLSLAEIQAFLNRRRPGQSEFTSPRSEEDQVEILSGTNANSVTLGSPICLLVRNQNQRSADYQDIAQVFRPSHADYTTFTKYGIREAAGGGRASARETIGRVAAAAVAKQLLNKLYPALKVVSWVQRIGSLECQVDSQSITTAAVDASPIRCPDPSVEPAMQELINTTKAAGDTLGGLITCLVTGVPPGWGEPVFDKLEANLAKAMLSLPASKSFEIGSGLKGTFLKGSEHNDPFVADSAGNISTRTNNSGGIQGGISNGMPIQFSVGFKPVSTLFLSQNTVNANLTNVEFTPLSGRHDSCVLPRAVPMIDAMTWLILADHFLLSLTSQHADKLNSIVNFATPGAAKC